METVDERNDPHKEIKQEWNISLPDLEEFSPTLAGWFRQISRYSHVDDFAMIQRIKDDRGVTFRFRIFTPDHRYSISARIPNDENNDGYLGCIASCRTPRAGEDWTRGSDLADGKFCEAVWHRIVCDIVSYELQPLCWKK
jgi:hypothetical protein